MLIIEKTVYDLFPFLTLNPLKSTPYFACDVEYCIFPSKYLRMTRTFLLHRPIIRAADSQLD